eukprot:jgi/Chlat1/8888/Chrsp92S08203
MEREKEREREGQDQEPLYSSFVCPVSLQVMSDPVIVAATHQTVDRSSARAWFDRGHRSCPVTGAPLASLELIPNYGLRHAIEEWLARKSRKGRAREDGDEDEGDEDVDDAAAAPPRSRTQREQLVRESAAAAARAECRFIEEVISRARSQDGRNALVSQRERLVPRLTSLLRASQISAAEALMWFSLDSGWQQHITEAPNTLPTIVDILQMPTSAELRSRVLELLTQLTFDNNEAKVSISVSGLLTELARLLRVPESQLAAARVMSNLAGSDICRICLAEVNHTDVASACVELLRPEHDGDIHEAALRLLRRLALHGDMRRKLCLTGSLKVRLQALAYSSATSVPQGSGLLLDTLARGLSEDGGNMQDYSASLTHEQPAAGEDESAFEFRPPEGLFEFSMGRVEPARLQQWRRRKVKRRASRRQQMAMS